MKKLIVLLLSCISLSITAQTVITQRAYLIRQVWHGDTIEKWMGADTVYYSTNQNAYKFDKPIVAPGLGGGSVEYLYKTVYVDSAKIRDYFDTLLIVSPGVNKIIVIDQMDVKHNGGLNYNSMACFMLYNDTILGSYTPDATPYDLINRTLFWETKAGGPTPSFYSQAIYTTVVPYNYRITCIQCPDMDNWVGVDDPSPWQIARVHYPNKGVRFLAGDFFYYNGVSHNATGRRIFEFTVKYHIETIN